jgi:hypothetical protein
MTYRVHELLNKSKEEYLELFGNEYGGSKITIEDIDPRDRHMWDLFVKNITLKLGIGTVINYNEKPILPVDIFNDDHLQELIENYEVYVTFIKDIIQVMGKDLKNHGIWPDKNYEMEYEDYIAEVNLYTNS